MTTPQVLPKLITIDAAAAMLGVPAKSLLRAAKDHGHLVQVGRAVRIPSAEIEELINKCRCQEKAPASSSANDPVEMPSGSSRIPANQSVARAQAAASKLKSCSRNTSGAKGGKVVRLPQRK